MIIFRFILGSVLFLAGMVYFYKPHLIYKLNSLLRDTCFSDRMVILYHKKIAVILILLSFIALYMAAAPQVGKTPQPQSAERDIDADRLAAMDLFFKGNYKDSLKKTYLVLSKKPNDEWALTQIGYIYEMLDDNQKAAAVWEKILSVYPENMIARKALAKYKKDDPNKRKN